MTHRSTNYIAVAEHRWQLYVHAVGIAKRLLHIELFYTGAPFRRLGGLVTSGEIVVVHPLLDGAIPGGLGKGEHSYADETPPSIQRSKQGTWA